MASPNKDPNHPYNKWQALCSERKEKIKQLRIQQRRLRTERDREIELIKNEYQIKIDAVGVKKQELEDNKPLIQPH